MFVLLKVGNYNVTPPFELHQRAIYAFSITCLKYVCTWLNQHLHRRPRCLQKLQNEKKNKNNGQEGEENVTYVLFLLRKYSTLPNLRMGEFLHTL